MIIEIEVAFATFEKQKIIKLKIDDSISITEAISLSAIQEEFPSFDVLNMPTGIFGKKINPQSYKLRNADRIEIYRPLSKTPNERRIERHKQNK
ncbi:MAG TPA: RnfH family protein [Burkholderiales bacterium]|mgnify:CR=1 FL=1|nr:RnfH family protein [Burkholderiales bacterium]